MWNGAVALWCALALTARAVAYTVDCNQEYTDCDTELSKLTAEDDELLTDKAASSFQNVPTTAATSSTFPPTRSTPTTETTTDKTTELQEITTEQLTDAQRHQPRLLNLNVDELQTFANALHNQTNHKVHKKPLTDLSDVTLDDDEDDPKMVPEPKQKVISDKFYTNLQAPFHPVLGIDRGSSEVEFCRENGVTYKIGEKMERGCEETCECVQGGVFECSPRCKHPYIRRGRRLDDPLCFESPLDECCSIIACATGNGDVKVTKLEVCRYGNDTYPVGAQWHIGCEQTCSCEKNSVVTCKPRCERHPPSDKCINVQDPSDVCCEVQVCDVSQDVHEEPENVTSSTTTTTTEMSKSFEISEEETSKMPLRPLVLSEPIGSVKVLQNNTVQVNLIHMNNSEDPIHLLLSSDNGKSFKDVELKYSNLILNLEGGRDYILKTRETGTKFNFTITTTDAGFNEVADEGLRNASKVGCYHDGTFYAVGEEFHIGCEELCECTGQDERECAALICPAHVGLELVSKGCVRWAPTPPARPPNCCPRAARCLSDGSCHYKGHPVPNWSEVPIELTGCEQRCFCENGELECQETCSPLPPLPPQTLRCPPMHRPAPVNISDDDCCKQWGCVPNAGSNKTIHIMTYSMPTMGDTNYVTPIVPILPTMSTSVLPTPPITTDPSEFYRHLNPIKVIPKYIKAPVPNLNGIPQYSVDSPYEYHYGDNITVFTLEDGNPPDNGIHPDPKAAANIWHLPTPHSKYSEIPLDPDTQVNIIHMEPKLPSSNTHSPTSQSYSVMKYSKIPQRTEIIAQHHSHRYNSFKPSHINMHDNIQKEMVIPSKQVQSFGPENTVLKDVNEKIKKVPISQMEQFHYFVPLTNRKPSVMSYHTEDFIPTPRIETHSLFEPMRGNHTEKTSSSNTFKNTHHDHVAREPIQVSRSKHVTILSNKELKALKTAESNQLWTENTKTHLLTKAPNPYETVLLRAVPNAKSDVSSNYDHHTKTPKVAEKTYSTLDLEHLLSQMEVESEVNRNLGRSADKSRDVEGQMPETEFTTHPPHAQAPGFLPTIPPEITFPQEDLADYDQNNIHRPVNTLPGLPPGLPPGIHGAPPYGDNNKKLSVISLQSDSPTSVMMLFGLPPVLVGLRGSVDLRYTDKADEDVSHWFSQVFAPADEVLTTPRLEFRLTGLKPSTTYKVRGKLYLHNLPVEPESEVYTVRTQDLPTVPPIEEKRREIDSRLTVVDVNDTSAHVSWRHFSEEELQFIDGIQVRYRPVGTPIYSMTELLHHSRSAAQLHELRPGARYEASLVLVPPPRASTELHDPGVVEFTTANYVDPYNWTVTVEARAVGSEAAELSWRGVPAPAERWVRVYRAAHACGDRARREHDLFKLATRDLPPALTITGLEPNTRCRVWLELFLTNGKVKTSNVLEITTKSLDSHDNVDNNIEAASASVAGSRNDTHGDYYGALVIVGVVAALGALTSLLLLLVVVRRHRPRSVPITRKYGAREPGEGCGNYHGALVIVGVVAALGALTSLLLLLVVVRRHRPRSVPITRKYGAREPGEGCGNYHGALVIVGVVAALGALTSLLLLLVVVRRHRPRSVPITRKYGAREPGEGCGNYHGALVIVGVVAALGALTSLLLLLVVVRRHRPRSVPITRKYGAREPGEGCGNYHGALVIVGVVAALGALTSLLLLLVVVRRHRPRSVPITRKYGAREPGEGCGNYHGALVIVGVVAALGALTSLLLLLVVVRRHRPRSVPITRKYGAREPGEGCGNYHGALVIVGVVAALGALTSLLLLLVVVRRHRPRSVPITRKYGAREPGEGCGNYHGALVIVGVVAALGALTSLLLLLVVVRRHRPRSVPITRKYGAREPGEGCGNYHGALVIVGVVAALGALTSLLLLLVVVRRHRPRSVPITPVPTAPRESSLPPYDNPAYKLELQQETMDL